MGVKNTKINREKLEVVLGQSLDVKLSMLSNHLEICRLLMNSILEEEVRQLAGCRYSRDGPHANRYNRWGFNPGSVKLGDQRIRVDVPRVYDTERSCHQSLSSYEKLKDLPAQSEQLIKSVLHGLSMRDYGRVVDQLSDSFGLSASTISREFKERTMERLVEFEQRCWDGYDFVALYVDGKYLAGEQIIIALGVTLEGEKKVLGTTHASTENSKSISELFRSLIERGLNAEPGLLFVIDGGKGLKKAIDEVFGDLAVIQRCQWHKRENILSYLSEQEQDNYRDRLKGAYYKPTYSEAKAELEHIKKDLEKVSRSAANSLAEGLEQTLTLHLLELNKYFRKSFCTTNCIESLNSGLEKYLHKVKRWTNSDQRHRWVAAGLLAQEKKLRKVTNYKKLYLMKEAIINEVQRRKKAKSKPKEPLIFN